MGRRGTDDATVRDAPVSTPVADPPGPDTVPIAEPAEGIETILLPPRFEPIAAIGRGGMGRVIRVLDRSLNREVAVKLIHLQQLGNTEARQRFLREARAAGTLHHPNIVTVHDVAPGGEYLVMEFVDGESLASRLRREGRLAVDEVRRIGAALLGALATAHNAGIIHRDVKPANILIDPSGTVKLTDFGVASFGDSELTSTGQLIGTPAYMAPEQLRARRVDERADIYGAGATLFETATGTRLNDEKGRVDDPEQAVVDATGDEALARAIARAVLEKESERFPDAAAFAGALASRAVVPRRHRRRRIVAAIAGLVTVAGAATYLQLHASSSPNNASAPSERRVTTVAMLPFSDHVADPRLDFAPSGLPHLLGEQLGHVEHLRVLGYYRVRGQLGDPNAPPRAWLEAARALGADVVVRGDIEPTPSGVRVAIVVEQSDGKVLERVAREVAVDRVPDAVAALAPAVASAALGAPSALQPSATREFDLERELQLGIAAFERQDFDTANTHLTAAVARDDSLGEAHYYLAILDWWRSVPPKPDIEKALASPLGPIEHDFVVGLRMLVETDYPRVVGYFQELVRRAPDHRDVQYGLFEALFHGGHPREAMQAYRRLRELAPHFYVGAEHAMTYYLTRGDAAGIKWTLEHWDPPREERAVWAARAMMAEQHYADAVRLLEKAEEEPGAGSLIGRLLVETYAVSGQLGLAQKTNARLAATDPNYRAVAAYGLAIASGGGSSELRSAARHAADLGISGLKVYLARVDVDALDLPDGAPEILRKDVEGRTPDGHTEDDDLETTIFAGVLHDTKIVARARTSLFPQVAAAAEAIDAEARGNPKDAAIAWRRTLEHNSEGRLQIFSWYALAQNLNAVGDNAGVIAACDEVITPRYFTWSWASTVGPCLRLAAEAESRLGHADAARRRWQQLLALRSGAPASDDLIRAARAALATPERP